ncbi:hypothetical protein [Microbacterium sp. T2.11-28]|uniref:hypothetical protein n=1 Tax=unclassified Microbacterium TaxID=2609290 RepID=UPI002477749C|nr:hypothetical protein [Microbacterium sp. T2.11-28]CAI9386374.1 hypothetical protein MICABA_00349 [Microbacterium sp. T2.11-28]
MTSRVSTSRVFERDTPLFRESVSGRLDKFPRNAWARWGLRLLIAAFYAAVAVWFHVATAGDWQGTANAALAERVGRLLSGADGSDGVAVIGALYPPLTSLIAMLVPGGPLGLAIAGSLAAGLMLQLVVQSMRRRQFPVFVRLVFILTLGATPVFAYIATTNFEAIVGLMFFGLGMIDLVRFVTWANTQAGFRAGILFACAAFSDSTVTFSALVAAVAGTLIIQSRPGARFANAYVVAFPTITLFVSLALLGIAFGAGPLAMMRGDLSWSPDRFEAMLAFFATPAGVVYFAPVLLLVVTSFALRFPGTALIAVLLTASTLLAFILGLTPPGTAGINYTLMLLLAIAIVPTLTTLAHTLLTSAVSVVLWVIGWLTTLQWATLADWVRALGGLS